MDIQSELNKTQEKHREIMRLLTEIDQERMRLVVMGCELQGRIALLQELLAQKE